MKLSELTVAERNGLADEVGKSRVYLYQCAAGIRQPSPKLCRELVAKEPRLTLAELRPDLWAVMLCSD
ncbi:helix-turn-helix domain-containing protein [Chitinolyticbacter meiyuanensis]|uniref:helix-turn-helix domain-containing protein n=1 Tax=Chitinolyticbacter meiyuanensis TaxID=682798 RepID=UPI0011E5EECE|nr:helix-turn-helix domain-containing protein [Chitinolyticbacter meiyuanensis]